MRLAVSSPAGAVMGLAGTRPSRLAFSAGGQADGSSIRYRVEPGETKTVYAAWLSHSPGSRLPRLGEGTYAAAREGLIGFWQSRLAQGATIDVPEQRVQDAEQSLLIQELGQTWRYSIGNPYQELSVREGLDVAEVMAAYGYGDVTRAMLRTSLHKLAYAASNSRLGDELVATARYYRLSADRAYVQEVTHTLTRFV